ncbi:Hint domain-containing protein [Falsiroseomonas sp. HW251]|uniref:Hint domain-containing protein n=1 Tax=Falsiroseomonas sp. HW251 TaxID=3390998 RepID=UPI003D320813
MPDRPADTAGPRGLAEGTRVFTLRGEVAVASLRPGDMLVTLAGQGAPMKPLLALHRGEGPGLRIAPGALGPGIPARDLLLGAGQALRVDGLLLPAGLLAGLPGVEAAPACTLFQPELAAPDLLMAEGTPVAPLPGAPEDAAPDPAAVAALRARLLARAAPRAAADPRDALLDAVLDGPAAAPLDAGAAPLLGPGPHG